MALWLGRTGQPRGQVLNLEQLWALAQAWYYNRLRPDYHGRSLEEAQDIFRALGLDAPFWYLPA